MPEVTSVISGSRTEDAQSPARFLIRCWFKPRRLLMSRHQLRGTTETVLATASGSQIPGSVCLVDLLPDRHARDEQNQQSGQSSQDTHVRRHLLHP